MRASREGECMQNFTLATPFVMVPLTSPLASSCHALPPLHTSLRDWADFGGSSDKDFGGFRDNENTDADFANFGESPTAASTDQAAFFNAGDEKGEEKGEEKAGGQEGQAFDAFANFDSAPAEEKAGEVAEAGTEEKARR